MKTGITAFLAFVFGGLVVFGALALRENSTAVRTHELEARVAELEHQLEAERSESAAMAERLGSPRRRTTPEPTGTAAAPEAVEASETAPEPSAAEPSALPEAEGLDAAARARRVRELKETTAAFFQNGDGEGALAALKELAALVPEGRDAAMALAVEMNEDVNGPGKLKLGQMTFYTGLGDPAIRSLMQWSLDNPSTTDFRVISAYSLPWIQDPDETAKVFAKALDGESDFGVQQALVSNLARLRRPESDTALRDIFGDTERDGLLRARVLTELSDSTDAAMQRLVDDALANDPSADVRAAARAAVIGRDPPVTGYLVTGTTPESQGEAAGLRPGDIVVKYDGNAVRDSWGLSRASRETDADQPVPVVVVRDGGEVTLLVRAGRLGVYGRSVKATRAQ